MISGATSSGAKNCRVAALLVSVALYVAACCLPALMLHTGGDVYTKDLTPRWRWDGHESLRGVELLFTGWFGLMLGNFAVLANPALWWSWLLFWTRRNRGATVWALAALALAMLTFQLSVQAYYFDEAGARRGYLEIAGNRFRLLGRKHGGHRSFEHLDPAKSQRNWMKPRPNSHTLAAATPRS